LLNVLLKQHPGSLRSWDILPSYRTHTTGKAGTLL